MSRQRHSAGSHEKTWIVVTGPVGSGKSTLLKELAKHTLPNVRILPEPIELFENFPLWSEKSGLNYQAFNPLKLFYEKGISAFEFQMIVGQCMYTNLLMAFDDNDIVISERSIEDWFHVFCKLLHKSGDISRSQMTILHNQYGMWSTGLPLISKTFYLAPSSQVLMSRIAGRARDGVSKGKKNSMLIFSKKKKKN